MQITKATPAIGRAGTSVTVADVQAVIAVARVRRNVAVKIEVHAQAATGDLAEGGTIADEDRSEAARDQMAPSRNGGPHAKSRGSREPQR